MGYSDDDERNRPRHRRFVRTPSSP